MSPAPVVAAAAAGAVKGKSAANMAKAFKSMKETDWDGVNNAMQSIKDFGESASLVQETLTDIKDQADALKNIALATAMTQLAVSFNSVFEKLEPLATGIDKLVIALEDLGIKVFDTSKQIQIHTIEEMDKNVEAFRQNWHDFWVSMGLPPDPNTLPSTQDVRRTTPRGVRQLEDLEGGY